MKAPQTTTKKPQKKTPKMIKFRPALFWDTDPKTLDPKKHARYIIERVLDFGDLKEVGWVFKMYSKNKIQEVMNLPRSQVHRKSKVLWSLLLR